MCGFVAWGAGGSRPVDRDLLVAMTDALAHRGPDDQGFFQEDWLGLGFKRLSILDLSPKGHQPMPHPETGRVMVYNGEVYNYLEIREQLAGHGYRFRSDSDSEVVLKAFDHWGPDCVKHFEGMFAFVVADPARRELWAFRDPMGIKPLYLRQMGQDIALASEIKALLPLGGLSARAESLYELMAFRYVAGPNTLFKEVTSVLPGGRLFWRPGMAAPEQSVYFDLPQTLAGQQAPADLEACVIELRRAVEESVKRHLRSDVEVGVQLSGGLDSSLVTAISALNHPLGMHTFSVSFPGFPRDESAHQQKVSGRYGTIHHDLALDEAAFAEALPGAIWHMDSPLHDPNCVAIYLLCQMARQYVTVLLTGDGADEIFSGYWRYGNLATIEMKRRLGRLGLPNLPFLDKWPIEKGRGLAQWLAHFGGQNASIFASSFTKPTAVRALCPDLAPNLDYREELCRRVAGQVSKEITVLDQLCYLQPWLWRADKMGMAHGLECRVPFIVPGLVTRMNHVPQQTRVMGGERKYLLKRAAEPFLDRDTIYRRKIGFSTPFAGWLAGGGQSGRLLDIMSEPKTLSRGIFDPKVLKRLVREHKSGQADHASGLLWPALNLELWHRVFIDRTLSPQPA